MPANDLNKLPPSKAILMIRIIWGALLLGQLAFAGVEAVILSQPQRGAPPGLDPYFLLMINIAMLVTIVPATFVVRMRMFQRQRVNGVIPAATYSTGNVIFWAGCEAVSFFGLVCALIMQNLWPTILCVVVAMAIQIVTFPRLSDIQASDGIFKIQ